MQKFETTSATEAQRCRRAQYCGLISTVALAGSTVTGYVRSVAEDNSKSPKRWIVTIDLKSLPAISFKGGGSVVQHRSTRRV
jgi:hypothetical protein